MNTHFLLCTANLMLFLLQFWQVIHIDPTNEEELRFWEENNSHITAMARNTFAVDKVVALVCQNFTCSPAVTDPKSLEALLSKKPSSSS